MLLLARAVQDQAVPVANAGSVQDVWYSCTGQSNSLQVDCLWGHPKTLGEAVEVSLLSSNRVCFWVWALVLCRGREISGCLSFFCWLFTRQWNYLGVGRVILRVLQDLTAVLAVWWLERWSCLLASSVPWAKCVAAMGLPSYTEKHRWSGALPRLPAKEQGWDSYHHGIEENRAKKGPWGGHLMHPPTHKPLLTHVCLMCFFNPTSSGDPPGSPGDLLQCLMTLAAGKLF